MKCQVCGYENQEDNIKCQQCGYNLQENNIQKMTDDNKQTVETFANLTSKLIIIVPIIFIISFMRSGLDMTEILASGNIGIYSLFTLAGSLFLLLSLWGIGIKLRLDTFINCKKYPYNDFFIKISKVHMLRMEDLSDKIGYFEASMNTGILDIILIPLVAAIVVFDSVWGFPLKFMIELIILIITLIIFFMLKVYPDKINEKLKNDIRTEEGFKTLYYISLCNLILSLIAIIIHLML